jgi:hypothetical protein
LDSYIEDNFYNDNIIKKSIYRNGHGQNIWLIYIGDNFYNDNIKKKEKKGIYINGHSQIIENLKWGDPNPFFLTISLAESQ